MSSPLHLSIEETCTWPHLLAEVRRVLLKVLQRVELARVQVVQQVEELLKAGA